MKKSLSFLASATLALGILAPSAAEAATFNDVPDSYRFYEDIDFLSDMSIISGFPDGTFRPNGQVTRAQAAIMIGRTFNFDGTKRETTFPDVGANTAASGYIDAAVEAGIIAGFPDGTFRPDQTVTRGQLAILLTRAFELQDSAAVTFKDVSPSSAAYPYIGYIVAAGITSGYPDNTYRPNAAVTRGQFAAFTTRAIDYSYDGLPELGVDFLNVGQGDAILLSFPNGKNMLVDAARGDDAVSVALDELGVLKVDAFVATHPDADHIGGADYVIRNYGVTQVYDSGQDHTTQAYLSYLEAVRDTGARFNVPAVGQDISLDETVGVKVLHVDSDAADLNEGSIVLEVSYGNIEYLLTGDAGVEVEADLVAKYDLNGTEVLKVSHHGSDSGTSQALVDEAAPLDAILSYGEGNTYGHPTSAVVARLTTIGADLWHTPDGTVETWTDGYYVYFEQGGVKEPVPAPEPEPEPTPEPQPEPEPTPTPTIPVDNGKVGIVSKDLSSEIIGVKNNGTTSVDMSGWKLVSVQGNQTYTFPSGFILGAGKTVYVTSGPNAKEQRPTYLQWTTANIWLNSGDPAQLLNSAGKQVSSMQ